MAVLYADMVGYSRLIGIDDAGTLERLRALRDTLIDPSIAEHGGRIVQTGGDSLLVTFDSIDGAVQCAVKVQQQVPIHDCGQLPDLAIRFRIGINIGDAIADGTDLHGDAVNVAVRLQAQCPPSGICVTRAVRDHVRHRLNLAFEELGTLRLKNIDRPVEAFALTPTTAVAAVEQPEREPLLLPDKPSIAVLPFANMSGDPEQEYFVDGIVEDLITGLSRIGWLHVIARNSAFVYKGRAVDVKRIGRELGVRYVLEGSLRKADSRVRVTAQLIAAASGTHLWAERYDRTLDNIFELQDEITLSVVGAIEPNLQHAEIEHAKRKRPDSLDAYDLYLRAVPHLRVNMPSEADKALGLLRQALAIQPDYPAVHAAAALCHEQRYMRGGLQEADKAAALKHARAAIEAGADDAETLATAGFAIGLVTHDYETAMNAIERGLKINGTSVLALVFGAIILAHAGHAERAVEYAERALRFSPLDPWIANSYTALGIAYCSVGNWEAVASACGKAMEANPRFSLPLVLQAAALSFLGRDAEARASARRVSELEPGFTVSGFVRSHSGRAEIWKPIGDALRRLGLPE